MLTAFYDSISTARTENSMNKYSKTILKNGHSSHIILVVVRGNFRHAVSDFSRTNAVYKD